MDNMQTPHKMSLTLLSVNLCDLCTSTPRWLWGTRVIINVLHGFSTWTVEMFKVMVYSKSAAAACFQTPDVTWLQQRLPHKTFTRSKCLSDHKYLDIHRFFWHFRCASWIFSVFCCRRLEQERSDMWISAGETSTPISRVTATVLAIAD